MKCILPPLKAAEIQDKSFESTPKSIVHSKQDLIAQNMANAAALSRNKEMSVEEMKQFVALLLANESFSITPEGHIITVIIELEDLLKKFN